MEKILIRGKNHAVGMQGLGQMAFLVDSHSQLLRSEPQAIQGGRLIVFGIGDLATEAQGEECGKRQEEAQGVLVDIGGGREATVEAILEEIRQQLVGQRLVQEQGQKSSWTSPEAR